MEGEGGRRKREGWKDHEREDGRVKREELRGRNCDSRLEIQQRKYAFSEKRKHLHINNTSQ